MKITKSEMIDMHYKYYNSIVDRRITEEVEMMHTYDIPDDVMVSYANLFDEEHAARDTYYISQLSFWQKIRYLFRK
jgi:hypothetical protein